jgi:eukaryotic-like serine/threonine-protein kinase
VVPTASRTQDATDEQPRYLERASASERQGKLPPRPDSTAREHYANIGRLQRGLKVGGLISLGFLAIDWLMSSTLYPGSFLPAFLVRLGSAPLFLLLSWRLRRTPAPSPRSLLIWDTATVSGISIMVGLHTMIFGGIAGPYPAAMYLVFVCRNAFLIQPWRRAWLPNALIELTYFATLAVCEWWQPESIATVGPENSLALVVLYFVSITSAVFYLTIASHAAWVMERRVFAARTLGQYQLIERIAEGGFGEVWSARHPGLKQRVAIKILKREIAEDARSIERFEREIDALSVLRHPNTVRIFDCGVSADGICYYVMELLEGETLSALVAREAPLPVARALHLAAQAAHAVAEAHLHGIVHRDIKPENIFVVSIDGCADFVKLLDFGIAKRLSEMPIGGRELTRTGMVVGTPAFMAPEVTRGSVATPRADIYALGATLHFLQTGKAPSQDCDMTAVTEPRPDDEDGTASREARIALLAMIRRCMEFDATKRYRDAQDLAQELDALKAHHAWSPRLRLLRCQEDAPSITIAQPTLQETLQAPAEDASVDAPLSGSPGCR